MVMTDKHNRNREKEKVIEIHSNVGKDGLGIQMPSKMKSVSQLINILLSIITYIYAVNLKRILVCLLVLFG